jgi:hypothetical protein
MSVLWILIGLYLDFAVSTFLRDHKKLFVRVPIEPMTKLATYLYFIVALATVQGFEQKRSLGVSTQRELSFGTNGVLIRRV